MAIQQQDREIRTDGTDETVTHDDDAPVVEVQEPQARGGVSALAVLTGVLVAFGLMALLGAIVAGLLEAFNVVNFSGSDLNVSNNEALRAGIGGAIVFVVTQFVSYLWGGYTAGRMARGAGIGNGLLVAVAAVVLAGGATAISMALGVDPTGFGDWQLPVEDSTAVRFGIGAGIAGLVAMFVGAMMGGRMGARWHAKLESVASDAERET